MQSSDRIIYRKTQFFPDHQDSFREPSVILAATRLLHHLESLFREDYLRGNGGEAFPIDRKRRRRLTEKKRCISLALHGWKIPACHLHYKDRKMAAAGSVK